jgi:hypothetical protein
MLPARHDTRADIRWSQGESKPGEQAAADVCNTFRSSQSAPRQGTAKGTVEHVHVHEGGQAIVGNVETKGGGVAKEVKEQPHALAYAPGATMPSPEMQREAVRVARDAERPLPDARRDVNGRAEGK